MRDDHVDLLAASKEPISFLSRLETISDESELLAELSALPEENAIRLLKERYQPIYLNLFSVFRHRLPITKIKQIAFQVTKSAIWSAAAANRSVSRYPYNRLQLSLLGWNAEAMKGLLARGRGLIVCSYRFGLYPLIPLDLAALGFPTSLPIADLDRHANRKALEELRHRVAGYTPLSTEERHKLQNICSIRLLEAKAEQSSFGLLKALRGGQVVMIYTDGNNGVDGPWGSEARVLVEFFGSTIFAKTGVARLSWALGTPILPVVSLQTGTDRGTVHLADPILPPDGGSRARRDHFVRTSTQYLYNILETYASRYPEQWQGVSALHRWRYKTNPAPQSAMLPVQQATEEVAVALREKRRLRINEPCGITAIPGEGELWVDTHTMKAFRIPSWAKNLGGALVEAKGVDVEWISGQNKEGELRSLLAELYARHLIAVV